MTKTQRLVAWVAFVASAAVALTLAGVALGLPAWVSFAVSAVLGLTVGFFFVGPAFVRE